MPKLLVLSDLDRTLFDTSRFFEDIWTFAASLYGLDANGEMARASEFHDMHGDSYDYRFFDHLQNACGSAYDQDKFIQAATDELSGRYVYPDVTESIVGLIDAIITFGGNDYQTFKLLLCPSLSRLPRHITLLPKGDYIARTFHEPSLLIDDKQLRGEIRPPARFVRIDRTGSDAINGERVIQDFSELPGLLAQLKVD